MLKRKVEGKLEEWLVSNDALLITGARQVGKSYLVREFGKAHFRKFSGNSTEDCIVRWKGEFASVDGSKFYVYNSKSNNFTKKSFWSFFVGEQIMLHKNLKIMRYSQMRIL